MEGMAERLALLETVVEELARERRRDRAWLRGWRGAAGCLAVLALVGFSLRAGQAQGAGSVVKAPFRVVDQAGRRLLEVDSINGTPRARFFDAKEQSRVLIFSDAQGGTVRVYNAADRRALEFACAAGESRLDLFNPAGALISRLGGRESGGELLINDGRGAVAARLGINSTNQNGHLRLYHLSTGQEIVALSSIREGGGGLLELLDPAGHVGAQVFARQRGGAMFFKQDDLPRIWVGTPLEGAAKIYFVNDQRVISAELGCSARGTGFLGLFDRSGKGREFTP